MAKKIVSLYVDDTSLRLMVADGKQIKEWAESPLEPGLIADGVIVNEAEVAAKVKQLFEAQKVKTKKVIIGVSGLRSLTRPVILPQLPQAMLDEAVRREAKRVLPVPLEQLYMSWQTIPPPEGKTQVFLAAIPTKTADPLLKALHQAGVKPSLMDIKPLLLAKMVKEATAVIVDIQTNEFDIVIMTDGIPQPVRSLPFPEEALPWEEKLTMIRNEINRTITFYDSNNPENTLASTVPIFVSGELAGEPEMCQSLSDELGHPVLPLPSPLECPDGLDPGRYLVNISLILKTLPSGESGPLVADLNILPAAYQPKPVSLINILALPGAAVAAGILVVMVMLIQGASADIASIGAKLSTAEQLVRQRQSQRQELTGKIAELETKIAEAEAARDTFTKALGSLEKQSTGINRDLEVAIEGLPADTSLSSITYASNTLTISGRAPSEKEVLAYLWELDAKGSLGDITVTNMSAIEGGGVEFTLLGWLEKQTDRASSIEVAVGGLPSTITLTSVSSTNGDLTINGRSPDEDEVLSYLAGLEASGMFRQIAIARMTRMEDGGIDFSLVLTTVEILEGGE